jgi:outer membrane autotransporter protein
MPLGKAATAAMPALPEGWGVWASGTITVGKAGRGSSGFEFNTAGVTFGADRAVNEQLLLGLAIGWGRQGTDFNDSPDQVDADQTSLSVYGLWRAGEHLFVDASLASGQLDFQMQRYSDLAGALGRGSRDGRQWFGSLTFGYEHRRPTGMTLTGFGRFDGSRSSLDGYREQGLGEFDLVYRGQSMTSSALAVGLEGDHAFQGLRSRWRPFWSVEYRRALQQPGDAAINYVVRPMDSDVVMKLRSYNEDSLSLGGGLDLQLDTGWMFSLLLGHEQGSNRLRSNSVGLQVRYGNPGRRHQYVDEAGLGYQDDATPCAGTSRRGGGRGSYGDPSCDARGIGQ